MIKIETIEINVINLNENLKQKLEEIERTGFYLVALTLMETKTMASGKITRVFTAVFRM